MHVERCIENQFVHNDVCPVMADTAKFSCPSSSLAMSILQFFGFRSASDLPKGSPLPDKTLNNHHGSPVSLQDYDKGWTMIYFYPKADTPGCTKQACSLRDAWTELSDENVNVFGVSGDSPEVLHQFAQKRSLPFTLLSDSDGTLADALGVPRLAGVPKRQAFLFRDGALVWLDRAASTNQQAEDVLAVIRES